MKKLMPFITVLSLLGIQFIIGQEENHLFLFDNQIRWINPALLGRSNSNKLDLLIESQWLGLKDAPKQQSILFDVYKNSRNLNTGAVIRNRTRFGEQTIQIFLQSAYPLKLSPQTRLYLGIQLLSEYFNSDYSLLRSVEGIANDPLLQQQRQLLPNMGLGFYLIKEKFWLQTAMPRLFDPLLRTLQPGIYLKDKPYFFTELGGSFSMTQFPHSIEFSGFIHNLAYDQLTVQIRSAVKFRNTELLFGVGSSKNMGFGFQYIHQNFLTIGYFFQFPFSATSALNKTNHGISLSFILNPKSLIND